MTLEKELDLFTAELEDRRLQMGISKMAFSEKAFGRQSGYAEFLARKNIPSMATLEKLATAAGRHVIICLSE